MTTQDKKELNIEEVSSVTGGNANVPDEPLEIRTGKPLGRIAENAIPLTLGPVEPIEIKTGPLMPGPTQKPDPIIAQLKQ